MAWTASAVADQEFRESLPTVEQSAEALASQIRRSTHFIAFTGAGISTSAGIPDFRGPDGHWTLLAQGRERTSATTNALQAIPTASHMALVELQNRGFLKYLVSQNCDGLHRRSGVPSNMISELHGNSNREYCKDCGKDYIRDFRAVSTYERSINDHRTGRKCTCGGALHDSIINFGEQLPVEDLQLAKQHARKADLCLVLGSSLTVTPANEVPELVGKKKNACLVICNLQQTPFDELAAIRVFSESDVLMTLAMKKLDIPIPSFILHRQLVVRVESTGEGRHKVNTLGVDSDGTPATFLRSVRLPQYRRIAAQEPFSIAIRGGLVAGNRLKLELQFMGHYNEPNLELIIDFRGGEVEETTCLLEYDPRAGKWTV
ncbi:hypothetical protein S7711_02362 [Stachybotrys chartarum IBT 7711]|uniref:protein acetyllysine N-acetyltransferase n=1 Tax=Stachybotrys chartarum (strain CBS 109288 / IBT 7711) TaxID=1280523 RepID=A0A084B127_STACB|nr:hypothetical protein S7711_02362 [Stachybotrys chartarum IBT 7711]